MQSPIVSTTWLAEHLHDDNLRVVDIRGNVLPATQPPPHYFSHREAYNESHIPNALFVDWMVDIVEPESPSNDVLSVERFVTLMRELGIDNDTVIVAYDDKDSMFAARFWWVMRYYGHEKVYVLDGGWAKWTAEERPVDTSQPDIPETTYTPSINADIRAEASDIEGMAGVQLVDVRSSKEFAGEASRANRMGHIPNAINLPRKTMVSDDHMLLSPEQLKAKFESEGVSLDADTIIYCNSGVSASYGMLAMEIVGAKNVRVYDGSWKDWGNDESKPIAKPE